MEGPPYRLESPFIDDEGQIAELTVTLQSGKSLHFSDRDQTKEIDYVTRNMLTFMECDTNE